MSSSAVLRSTVAQCAPPLAAVTSWAVINLVVVAHNGRRLAQVADVSRIVVVKTDTYGHRLEPTALTALSTGVSWLRVTQLVEALTPRALLDEIGVSCSVGEPTSQAPRFLTWPLPVIELDQAAAENSPLRAAPTASLDLLVFTLPQLEALPTTARAQGRVTRSHPKVDTGMSRSGATVEELSALTAVLGRAEDEGTVDVVGLWSHLSRADEPASDSIEEHLEHCRQAEQVVLAADLSSSTHHLAAIGGFLWHPQACMGLVCAGIGMYGLSPDLSVATGVEPGLRPAIRPEPPLVQVKRTKTGQTISYGGTWSAPTGRWVGLVPLGYPDGIPHVASSAGPVGVGSLMTSIVGRACMSQVVIDLGPAVDETGVPLSAAARVGDAAVLWGALAISDQEAVPTTDGWARTYGTINYEIVTWLGARIPRCYIGGSDTGSYSRPQAIDVGYRRSPPGRPVPPSEPYVGEGGI